MKVFVTGGAGFIGAHLVHRLQEQGHQVTVYDKVNGDDLLDGKKLREALEGRDIVYHLAANADTRTGIKDPGIDFEDGTVATHILLQTMKRLDIKNLVYASSAVVYGDLASQGAVDEHTPLQPISTYGASKVACEALINAYCHMFDFCTWIYRFGNISGSEGRYGVVHDLVSKLKENPKKLQVLGDGTAERSFLRVEDCVSALLGKRAEGTYNVGNTDTLTVMQIVGIICEEMNVSPEITYSGGKRGWKGDAPVVYLDPTKLRITGWKPSCTSEQAVRKTVRELVA